MSIKRVVSSAALALATCILAQSVRIAGQAPMPFINELPSPSAISATYRDLPDAEALARRAGLLWQLPAVVVTLAASEGRNERQLTAVETRVISQYRTAYTQTSQQLLTVEGDRTRLAVLERYKTDEALLFSALEDSGTPVLVARYRAAAARRGGINAEPASPPLAAKPTAALTPAPRRPAGPANAVVNIVAPMSASSGDTLYLLDDDLEHVLTAAGFMPRVALLGPLSLLQSLDLASRMKGQKDTLLGAVAAGFGVTVEEETRRYDVAMTAIAAHTVATRQADAGATVRFAAVPAGTYWVWTTHQQYVSTGAQGTVVGSTVTLSPTGYERVLIWNLKATLAPGANTVSLTAANTAFAGQ